MNKFLGKIEDLQKLISDLGCDGEWLELPNHQFQFTTSDGAILNWWQSTRTIGFQGPPTVKAPFEKQVTQAVLEWKPAPRISKSVPSVISMPSKNPENKRVFVVHG